MRAKGINTVLTAARNSHWQPVSYRCASCILHRDPRARVVSGAESCVGSVAQRKGRLSLKSNLQKAPGGLALALIIGHLCMPSGALSRFCSLISSSQSGLLGLISPFHCEPEKDSHMPKYTELASNASGS